MCLTKLRRHVETLLNMLIFQIQNISTCVSADKNVCACICVCVCACGVLFFFGGGGASVAAQRLNLPPSDGNRWTQLGRGGGGDDASGVLVWSRPRFTSARHQGENEQPKPGGSYSKPAGLALRHAGLLF